MATTEDRYISLLTDSPEELYEYEDSLKTYRDLKNSFYTAEGKGVVKGIEIGRAEGIKKGRAEEKMAIAQKMKAQWHAYCNHLGDDWTICRGY